MKGTYVLLIELPKSTEIQVGSLGKIKFQAGFYAYVGSALRGLEGRIRRHMKMKKKLHWHIDHLLAWARIKEVYADEREECSIAAKLAERLPSVKGFGSSDCDCESHLFYSEDYGRIRDVFGINPPLSM